MKIRTRLGAATLILIMTHLAQQAHGAGVLISWQSNSEPDVAGYRVYYGTATGNYQHILDVGPFTSAEIDLPSGATYYFAVTCYDTSGNESGYSREVMAVIESACRCDLNHNGRCDMDDWQQFSQNWGATDCTGLSCACDLNHDGRCNMVDWQLFMENWGDANCTAR